MPEGRADAGAVQNSDLEPGLGERGAVCGCVSRDLRRLCLLTLPI